MQICPLIIEQDLVTKPDQNIGQTYLTSELLIREIHQA